MTIPISCALRPAGATSAEVGNPIIALGYKRSTSTEVGNLTISLTYECAVYADVYTQVEGICTILTSCLLVAIR